MSLSLTGGGGLGGPITVVSDDNEKWTRIEDSEIDFDGNVHVKMKWPGKINAFGLYWGKCKGDACFETPGTPLMESDLMEGDTREINKSVRFQFSSNKIPGNTLEGFPTPPSEQYAYYIIQRCNQALSQGKTIHETQHLIHPVPITLGVDSYIGDHLAQAHNPGFSLKDVDHQKTVFVAVQVVCKAVPKREKIQAPLTLVSANFAVSHGNYHGACPVDVHLLGGAITNVSGPIEVQIESKSGGKSNKATYKTTTENANGTWQWTFDWPLTVPGVAEPGTGGAGGAGAAAVGGLGTLPKPEEPIIPGGGTAQIDQKVVTGYKPPNVHEDSLRLVVSGGGKTIATDWRKYKVTCDPKKTPEVGDVPQGLGQTVFVKQAALTLIPHAPQNGSKCGLTVSGYIQTNVKNVDVTFRLKNHQGNTTNAQTIKTSHAGNIGKFVEYVDFSTSGQGIWVSQGAGWALPGAGAGSQAGPKQGSLLIVVESPKAFDGNVASYDFTCHEPAPAGLKTAPTVKVNPDLPKGPSGVVGKAKPQTAEPGDKIAPPVPPIVCLGGKVKDGKCLCDGETVVIGGLMSSGKPAKFRCVAKNTPSKQIKPEAVGPLPQVVVPLPKVSCAGGKVKNGACVCGKGMKPVKAGSSAYRCTKTAAPTIKVVPLPAKIAYVGGVVRANKCYCPSGKSLKNGVCTVSR